MPVVTLRNTAAGPRVFNLAGGRTHTLMPGETKALDLVVAPDQDVILGAWIKTKEVEVLDAKAAREEMQAAGYDPAAHQKAMERLREAQAEVEKHDAVRVAVEMDQARRTPPRQLGGDGGPEQAPTVDGNPGAPTPNQGEGTPEQRAAAGENAAHQRATEDREKAAREKAAADKAAADKAKK